MLELLLVLYFDLLSLFDALLVHETLLVYDEVVQRPPPINPIRLLKLLGIRKSVKEEEELRVVLLIVDSPCQRVHLFFDLAHGLLFVHSGASIQRVAHVHD